MQDSVNDNLTGFDFEEHPVISYAEPITRLKLDESFDVAVQIVARDAEFGDDLPLIVSLKVAEIFLSPWLELDRVFHVG